MKKLILLLSLLTPFLAKAQEQGVDEKIDQVFGDYTNWFVNLIFYTIPFSESVKIPWVLIVLVFGAVYFTIYFKFINIKGFFTAIRIVQGKYDDIEEGGYVEASDTVF